MYLQFIAFDTATPRHAFALTDDQARVLARHVAALQTSHPLDPRNHRAFVRAFLRAVLNLDATGQLYSPAIYHRLLAALAPERRPSTSTQAAEKQALAGEAASPAKPSEGGTADDTAVAAIGRRRATALGRQRCHRCRHGTRRPTAFGNGSQLACYGARLRETEQQLLDVREYAARLPTDVALARQLAEQHEQAAKRAGAALALRVDAVAKLTAEVTALPLPAWRPITTRHGLY